MEIEYDNKRNFKEINNFIEKVEEIKTCIARGVPI